MFFSMTYALQVISLVISFLTAKNIQRNAQKRWKKVNKRSEQVHKQDIGDDQPPAKASNLGLHIMPRCEA
ncbi:hypothetical protein ACJIZ3_010058 [Penstemon smallii]|uniref:Uncharacterized protein n=1 Tax=Penstemon smallii TaxID=265156 RepID=A0ABD3TE88_9LAMI